jgi:hypothetical protein
LGLTTRAARVVVLAGKKFLSAGKNPGAGLLSIGDQGAGRRGSRQTACRNRQWHYKKYEKREQYGKKPESGE